MCIRDRVYTGIFQYCGWLGETSTEVAGFEDLHLIPGYDDNPIIIPTSITAPQAERKYDGAFYDLTGRKVEHPTRGIYIQNGKKIVIK